MQGNLELLRLALGKNEDAIKLLEQFGLDDEAEAGLAALVAKWEDEEKSTPEDRKLDK